MGVRSFAGEIVLGADTTNDGIIGLFLCGHGYGGTFATCVLAEGLGVGLVFRVSMGIWYHLPTV